MVRNNADKTFVTIPEEDHEYKTIKIVESILVLLHCSILCLLWIVTGGIIYYNHQIENENIEYEVLCGGFFLAIGTGITLLLILAFKVQQLKYF